MSGGLTDQGVPQSPITDQTRNVTLIWRAFFVSIWNRTGGATGSISAILDSITVIPGSLLFRGIALWQGLNLGTQYKVLRAGLQFPEWDFLDGNSFGPQPQNEVYASPSGASGPPSFRALVGTDLAGVNGQYPGTATDDDANAGNIGEYIFSQVAIGAAVVLSSGVTADITSLNLSPGDWDVWGSLATAPAGTTTQSDIRGWLSTASATDPGPPNSGSYAELNTAIAAGKRQALPIGSMRVTVPAGPAQALYLSANVTFATSTLEGYGFLGARRRR